MAHGFLVITRLRAILYARISSYIKLIHVGRKRLLMKKFTLMHMETYINSSSPLPPPPKKRFDDRSGLVGLWETCTFNLE